MLDPRVHHHVIQSFIRSGAPPTRDEIASALGASAEEVARSLHRLHDGHGLVLHPGTQAIWIAHPFSASPTAVWIEPVDPEPKVVGGRAVPRGWWAPCLWCASGVVALAARDARIHVREGGENHDLDIEIRNGQVVGPAPLVHFALPPADAWANVVHWCATVLPFRDEDEVAPWCDRHRIPVGAVVTLPDVLALGRIWYGRHADEDWRKWTVAEAQQIFHDAGLTAPFWELPTSDRPF